jgi:hypothetical protein
VDCIIDLLRAPSEDLFMERRSLLEAPKPFFEIVEIVWIHAALCVHTNTLATPFPLSVSELEVSAATLFSRYSTPPNA